MKKMFNNVIFRRSSAQQDTREESCSLQVKPAPMVEGMSSLKLAHG